MTSSLAIHPRYRAQEYLCYALLVTFVLVIGLILFPLLVSSLDLYPKSPNEGWNAIHAARAMRGDRLYPVEGEFYLVNYPPLSFYIVGGLGNLIGDNIIAGRILSITAYLVIGFNVMASLRYLGANWSGAVVGCLVYAGGLLCLGGEYVGMNDPQLVAHAVMMSGLTVLLSRPGAGWHLWVAAALMVGGGLIKHNLLALPAAVTVYYMVMDRRVFWHWLAAAVACLGVALAGVVGVFGTGSIDNILMARTYSWVRLLSRTLAALDPIQLPFLLGVLLLLSDPRSRATRFVLLYGSLSLVTGVAFLGGHGVSTNALFDLAIALGLAAGLLWTGLPDWLEASRVPVARLLLLSSLVFTTLVSLPQKVLDQLQASYFSGEARPLQKATAEDVAYLRRIDGPVVCQELALCYWADKELEVDFFTARQAFLFDQLDPARLLDEVADGVYAVIQLNGEFAMSDAFMEALACAYRRDRKSQFGDFFRPIPMPRC